MFLGPVLNPHPGDTISRTVLYKDGLLRIAIFEDGQQLVRGYMSHT